ncbi:germinal-center associated nuclear protein-like, partial [Limulus polyphemus]|uniref:Germinal-center associated nuclear protein-like n=1 Tax=Limulus polyphemus TaxID=6850 RepID=A0ABM1C3C5_LIMPO
QVQQFRPEIRDSPQVKFAIMVFSAINSNNYVRFFRLVKEATYLNTCILHRYFYQVRTRAAHALLKAYCLPNHTEEFPVKEMKRLLAFESEEEVKNFCNCLGLTTSNEFVTLDRSSFIIPVTTPSITRAIQLVESKRTTSVGEVGSELELCLQALLEEFSPQFLKYKRPSNSMSDCDLRFHEDSNSGQVHALLISLEDSNSGQVHANDINREGLQEWSSSCSVDIIRGLQEWSSSCFVDIIRGLQ